MASWPVQELPPSRMLIGRLVVAAELREATSAGLVTVHAAGAAHSFVRCIVLLDRLPPILLAYPLHFTTIPSSISDDGCLSGYCSSLSVKRPVRLRLRYLPCLHPTPRNPPIDRHRLLSPVILCTESRIGVLVSARKATSLWDQDDWDTTDVCTQLLAITSPISHPAYDENIELQ